ncbi:helix-turn-helix transcriptional regulator [Paenibacillus gansuensis]|uniref:AraC family transcriptional regulator n=1 Tax=Paenibacillus gansuensis TaxID=306542 RepID=A0ABW5PKT9_9BACL
MTSVSYERVFTPGDFARAHLFFPLLGGYDEADPLFSFERGHYPAYELLLIERGRGSIKHGGVWIPLTEGDCLLHDMRVPHAYRADASDPFAMYYIVMDGLDIEPLWRRFTSATHVVFASADGPVGMKDTLLQALRLLREDGMTADAEIPLSALLYRLLVQALSHSGGYGDSPARKPEVLEKARAFLDTEYLTVRQIREAADRANMSLYHFIRQFRRHYGTTPKEYVLHKRIHHAKRLLLRTESPIADIAEASGFPSYNAFLHSFLRTERQSPGEYRKQWQKKSPKSEGEIIT